MGGTESLVLTMKNWLSGDGKIKIIVAIGILGMALILLSQFIDSGTKAKNEPESLELTSAEYVQMLEERLELMISQMEGAGETRVMITLEDTGEVVYAREEKRNVDTQRESNTESVGKSYQKESTEQKYIIVDGKEGRQALVKTKLEPRVQGVVVMCRGAGNLKVEQDIIHVVTTALNIPTTRVCVVKISK
ncbi:MAG: stage III sporulation protein AG [Oscillospiraceae bacterium]|nr:stage III sporulation protein AG [Oscillospiraceae bacterium]